MRTLLAAATAACALAAGVAQADVISGVTDLPGGVQTVIVEPGPTGFVNVSGPIAFQVGDVVWSADHPMGYLAGHQGWGFGENGVWDDYDADDKPIPPTPMIGLNDWVGSMKLEFGSAIAAFTADINWANDDTFFGDVWLDALDADGNVLERIDFFDGDAGEPGGGHNVVAPGYWGFSRESADIKTIVFNRSFIGARDISYSLTPLGAVPEPATWAMMILGFAAAGASLRTRRGATV